MKNILAILGCAFALGACVTAENKTDYTAYVNPFIGTGGHGHTFPGAIVPHGMIQPSPDTRIDGWDACSGYHYSDSILNGFTQTHLSGTGCADYGDFLLMPTCGNQIIENQIDTVQNRPFASSFSHADETATPGYYSTFLKRYGIKAEVTATERAASFRFTVPDGMNYYQNLFDKEYSLMRGRNADGSFAEPFSPLKWGDAFTEGNAWHYTWSIFHDPEGLKQLMGGEKRFVAMLDSVFSVPPVYDDSYYGFPIHEIREMTVMNMGNYAHGNQPIQHMIYLYDWTDQPWKTQYHVREVMDRMYSATPDGYCGDEDNGQTSAWYVFSALGFYPVTPASDQYALGSPLFRKAVLKFENGRSLILNADNNTNDTPYIAGLMVNGIDYNRNYITHGMLLDGGQIDFDMVSAPNMSKQINKDSYPYSFSCDEIK